MRELSADEQDCLAANCPVCWAYPGDPCQVIAKGKKIRKTRRHPHPGRIDRAERRGILGGAGRILLTRAAYQGRKGWVT